MLSQLSPSERIDAELAQLGLLDDYGTLDREWAIDALDRGRACVLTTGRYHNQMAANLCAQLNRDHEHLIDQVRALIAEQGRSVAVIKTRVLPYLHPVNEPAEAQIECVRLFIRAEELEADYRADRKIEMLAAGDLLAWIADAHAHVEG